MLAWTLNTNAENGASSGRGCWSTSSRGRATGQVDHGVEQHAHAEVGERRAEEHRGGLAGQERSWSRSAPTASSRPISSGRPPGVALLGGGPLGVDDLLAGLGGAAGGAGEAV
jgi:hypothetical protein